MKTQSVCLAGLLAAFLFFGIVPVFGATDNADQKVRIGVLAHRSAETALRMWTPTAEYLSKNIPDYSFTIVPLGFHEIGPAVEREEVDFVLANSSIYVELEARYNANRIATLRNDGFRGGQTVFGGAIFCRADRSDISGLSDLKGKSFLAVDEASLGGWQVAWRELKNSGLDPYRDFSRMGFAETIHDDVVYAVRDGNADAGTVRTDTLERMAEEGKIDLHTFRILNQKKEQGFPFLLSTRLYPEWPLAMTRHTDLELAEEVVTALLKMPHDSPAAKAGNIEGWTIPLVYQPVHDLMKELHLGPYKDYGRITAGDVLRQYWLWIVIATAAMFILIYLTLHVLRLNGRLLRSKQLVEEARNGLEQQVQERTADLITANKGLNHEVAERRRTEEMLRKLSRAVEQSPTTIVITDHRGIIEYVNPKFSQITGYSAEEAVGNTPRVLQSGRTPREVYDSLWSTIRAGHEWHGEFCNKKKNGELYWESATIAPIINNEGAITHYVAIKEDITESKKAETELRQAKEEWERTFDAITDPLMILDTNYRIIKANKSMANALGVTQSDAVGMTCFKSVHGTEAPPGYCPHAKLLMDGQARSQEIHEPRLGGHYLITVSPLFAPDGTLLGSIHAARDITELKRAEDIVRKSEKYMRDVTASLGEGVYVLDPQGNVTFMNPEAEALLGWSEKELTRKNIHNLVHNRRADGTSLLFEDCSMRKVIESGGRFSSADEVFVRKDGTVFPVSVHCRPLMEDGQIIASVTAFRDISERKRIEQEREQLIADLQKALAEIKTLHGILPICSYCKKIRDDRGAWIQLESYISNHTNTQFSHGICRECAKKEFPEYYREPEE